MSQADNFDTLYVNFLPLFLFADQAYARFQSTWTVTRTTGRGGEAERDKKKHNEDTIV